MSSIPQIAVTVDEVEENADHSLLDLAEALTDVEDLLDKEKVPKKKSSLKIKLVKNDYTTELEDFEASDNEAVAKNYKFDEQFQILNFDDDQATTKTQVKTLKGLKQIESEMFSQNPNLLPVGQMPDDVLTDLEDFGTDDELDEKPIPDIDLNYDEYLKNDISIASCLRKAMESKPNHVKKNLFKNHHKLKVDLELQQNLTDSEMLFSDSEDNPKTKTRRRRPKCYQKHSDNAMNKTENHSCKYKRVKQDSLNLYENTNSLSFPVCKKVTNSKYEDLTDCENFDFDLTTPQTLSLDENKMEDKLNEFIKNYAAVEENHQVVNVGSQNVSPTKSVLFQEILPKYLRKQKSYQSEITESSSNSTTDDEMPFPKEFQPKTTEIPELLLPKPNRTLILLHEDKSIPNVEKPLDEIELEEDNESEIFSNEESLEFSDRMSEKEIIESTLPNYLLSDSEEYQKNSSRKLTIERNEESLTDTDEISLSARIKSPKGSQINCLNEYLTDTKDLNENHNFLAVSANVEGTTDVEDLSSSDDEPDQISKPVLKKMFRLKRDEETRFWKKRTCQMYCSKPKINDLVRELNEFHFITPRKLKKITTERPNSLKVEDDQQAITDVEDIEEDDFNSGKLKKSVSLDFKNGSVCFGFKEDSDFVKKSSPKEKTESRKGVEGEEKDNSSDVSSTSKDEKGSTNGEPKGNNKQ